jgi:hypothetical protein
MLDYQRLDDISPQTFKPLLRSSGGYAASGAKVIRV